MDINAIGETANDQYIRTKSLEFMQKRRAKLSPIIGSMASAYHIKNMKGIQIGISFEEKNNGSVITLPQTRRIILVNERQATDILLTDKVQFAPGTNDGLRTVQRIHYTLIYIRNQFGKFFSVPEYITGATRLGNQPFRSDMPYAGHHCQSDTVKLFFFVGYHFR